MGQPQAVHGAHRWALHQALAAHQCEDALIYRGRQILGCLVGISDHHRHAEHHIGLVEHRRRLEVITVGANRLMHVARRKVRGKGVRQAAYASQLGAEQAGTEQPDRHLGVIPRHGDHFLIRRAWAEVAHQFLDIIWEVVGAARALAAQGAGGHLVRAGRTPQAKVDTAGIEAGQGAELLGNYQWCVVGQHHPAGADADGRGAAGQVAEQH